MSNIPYLYDTVITPIGTGKVIELNAGGAIVEFSVGERKVNQEVAFHFLNKSPEEYTREQRRINPPFKAEISK